MSLIIIRQAASCRKLPPITQLKAEDPYRPFKYAPPHALCQNAPRSVLARTQLPEYKSLSRSLVVKPIPLLTLLVGSIVNMSDVSPVHPSTWILYSPDSLSIMNVVYSNDTQVPVVVRSSILSWTAWSLFVRMWSFSRPIQKFPVGSPNPFLYSFHPRSNDTKELIFCWNTIQLLTEMRLVGDVKVGIEMLTVVLWATKSEAATTESGLFALGRSLYLDFQKVFDKVSHTKLIVEIKNRISSDIVRWAGYWLTERRQIVLI